MEPNIYKGEAGYLELLQDILDQGVMTPDRTDVGECKKVFNQTLWFDLRESQPVITHRPIPNRWAFEEFWFFMSGETDTKILEEKGITLWKGNTSREFLDGRGLHDLEEGDMGKAYGFQWRHFGTCGYGQVDQLRQTVDLLKNDPFSRRILTTFWNPQDSDAMALLPCFYEHKFNVEKGEERNILHMTVKSRSCDAPFGLPFNLTQYGFYLKTMAKLVGMEAGRMVIELDDVHIYKNQVEWVEELLTRCDFAYKEEATVHILPSYNGGEGGSYKLPEKNKVTLHINKELNTLEDLVSLQWEDLELEGLMVNITPFCTAKPDMAI